MNNRKYRHIVAAILTFIALTIVGLWSWNTVVELFDGPAVEYRHVVAVFAIAMLLRMMLLTRSDQLSAAGRRLHKEPGD